MATLQGLAILAWYFIAALVLWLLQLYLTYYLERMWRQRHADYLNRANKHLQAMKQKCCGRCDGINDICISDREEN